MVMYIEVNICIIFFKKSMTTCLKEASESPCLGRVEVAVDRNGERVYIYCLYFLNFVSCVDKSNLKKIKIPPHYNLKSSLPPSVNELTL